MVVQPVSDEQPASDLSFDDATEVVASLTPGSFFGDRFRIGEQLGVGGMGAVYSAVDLRDEGRPVAVKVMLKGASDPSALARFEREYEALSAMTHPGIVRIHGFGYDPAGQTPWLAMERLEGETLHTRIKRKGAYDPRRFASVLARVAGALEAAHAQGVIHRDLKPDHVFLTKGPEKVKLIDFGLSLVRDSTKLTATGTVIGTPRYMAPEQIASAHNSGAPADVYALGVLTYEALCGDSPFVASDQGQLLGAILAGKRKPLGERRDDVPPGLDEVLNRAMAPKVEDRYKTPSEFARAYAEAVGMVAPRRKRATKRSSATYWVLLAIGTLLSGLLGAGISYLVSRG